MVCKALRELQDDFKHIGGRHEYQSNHLLVHQLRAVSPSSPCSSVCIIPVCRGDGHQGLTFMRSNAKRLVLEVRAGASFLDSSHSSMPRRLRSQH